MSWIISKAAIALLLVLPVLSRFPQLLGIVSASSFANYSALAKVVRGALVPGYPSTDPCLLYINLALGHRAALDWLSGTVPWWNQFQGVGMPLAADMQSGALFLPFTLLYFHELGQTVAHILLQCIAGVSTYCLLRRLGLKKIAAFAGGALFELNGTFVLIATATCQPIAFLPLLLLGIENARAQALTGSAGGWRLVAVSLALSLYAGFPETAYIDGLLAAVWTLVRLCQMPVPRRLAFVGRMMIGLVGGLMLAAPVVIPFLDYLHLAFTGPHTPGRVALRVLRPAVMPQLLTPYLYGVVGSPAGLHLDGAWKLVGGYIGAAPLFLCLLGVCGRKERALRIALGFWIFVALGKAVGIWPIAQMANLLPFMEITFFARYFQPTLALAVFILTAFALDDLVSAPAGKMRIVIAAILSLAAVWLGPVVLANPWVDWLVSDACLRWWLLGSLAWGAGACILAILAAGLLPEGRNKAALIAAVLTIEALGLFVVPAFCRPAKIELQLGGVEFLRKNLGLNRFYTLGPIEPSLGAYFGIASINHNDNPVPRKWTEYVSAHLFRQKRKHHVFVGFCFNSRDMIEPPETQLCKNMRNYEWVGVKYVVARKGTHPFTACEEMRNAWPVYEDNVMDIYELPHPAPYFDVISGSCRVEAISRTDADCDCQTDCLLLRRELFLPGWRATVDGAAVPVTESGELFQAVTVPAGRHHVRFEYTPPYLLEASTSFVLSLLMLVWGAVPVGIKSVLRFRNHEQTSF